MKKISLFFCFFSIVHLCVGQVRGNEVMTQITEDITGVTSVYVGLYADVEIDCSAEESFLRIAAEENLLSHIGRSLVDGQLRLDQIQWIQPTRRMVIRIGAPHLQSVVQSTHDTVKIIHINRPFFEASAEVGHIVLEGRTEELKAKSELGIIDAQGLSVDRVELSVTSRGSVLLSEPAIIAGVVSDKGEVLYGNSERKGHTEVTALGPVSNRFDRTDEVIPSTRFIDIRIKNNSWKHINAYVLGPKSNGKFFSYGFPMRPGQIRQERWTVGTKVYRKTALGTKKLLVEITESNENQVVNLHRKGE